MHSFARSRFSTTLAPIALFAALAAPLTAFADASDDAVHCDSCAEWNKDQAPFQVFANTYYVGTQGLSALLITSDKGHILLDGALPQSAALIEQHIAALGFKVKDIRLIVNSHAHWDHAGGIPALQKASGARVAASPSSAQGLRTGTNVMDDPQYEATDPVRIAKVRNVQVVKDGQTLSVGPLRLTAHFTPGHTPGSTAWTWQSCAGSRCLNMVYADSLTAVSSDGFRFSGGAGKPDISASFRRSIDKVAQLPCDVVISTHPGFTQTFEKLASRTADNNTFVTPGACKAYADKALTALNGRLAKEAAGKVK